MLLLLLVPLLSLLLWPSLPPPPRSDHDIQLSSDDAACPGAGNVSTTPAPESRVPPLSPLAEDTSEPASPRCRCCRWCLPAAPGAAAAAGVCLVTGAGSPGTLRTTGTDPNPRSLNESSGEWACRRPEEGGRACRSRGAGAGADVGADADAGRTWTSPAVFSADSSAAEPLVGVRLIPVCCDVDVEDCRSAVNPASELPPKEAENSERARRSPVSALSMPSAERIRDAGGGGAGSLVASVSSAVLSLSTVAARRADRGAVPSCTDVRDGTPSSTGQGHIARRSGSGALVVPSAGWQSPRSWEATVGVDEPPAASPSSLAPRKSESVSTPLPVDSNQPPERVRARLHPSLERSSSALDAETQESGGDASQSTLLPPTPRAAPASRAQSSLVGPCRLSPSSPETHVSESSSVSEKSTTSP